MLVHGTYNLFSQRILASTIVLHPKDYKTVGGWREKTPAHTTRSCAKCLETPNRKKAYYWPVGYTLLGLFVTVRAFETIITTLVCVRY